MIMMHIRAHVYLEIFFRKKKNMQLCPPYIILDIFRELLYLIDMRKLR